MPFSRWRKLERPWPLEVKGKDCLSDTELSNVLIALVRLNVTHELLDLLLVFLFADQ